MRKLLLGLAAIVLPATVNAAASLPHGAAGQGNAGSGVDLNYLNGRWCDSTDAWMTFDAASRQINLPNGNTGQRVIGTFRLEGNTVIINGPAGAIVRASFRRLDATSMGLIFNGSQEDIVRRC